MNLFCTEQNNFKVFGYISRPGCFGMNLMTACLKAEIYRSKIEFKNAN